MTDDWKKQFKQALLVGVLGVIGFSVALTIHAGNRGNSIKDGLVSIYEQDVKRRTYGGDPEKFKNVAWSLKSSPFTVVNIYIKDFRTAFLGPIPGAWFQHLLLMCFFFLGVERFKLKQDNNKMIALFLLSLLFLPLGMF